MNLRRLLRFGRAEARTSTSPTEPDVPRARPGLLQGDVVVVEGKRVVVLSRSCDLVRSKPARAVVANMRDTDDKLAHRGWQLRQVRIPGAPGTVADMTTSRSVDKRDLPHAPDVRGCRTAGQARQFQTDVGRAFSVPSHADGFNTTVAPLGDELRKRKYRETDKALMRLSEAIKDIRVEFDPKDLDPADEDTLRECTLSFVVDSLYDTDEDVDEMGLAQEADPRDAAAKRDKAADEWRAAGTVEEQAAALFAYCIALAGTCTPVAPISSIKVEVVPESRFSVERLRQTDEFSIEALSA